MENRTNGAAQSSDFPSCHLKQSQVKLLFSACQTPEQKYLKIIELGRALPPLPPSYQTEANRVTGCQSQMYLHACYVEGKVLFQLGSEALVSAGLGALLLSVYNDESPEAILSCPPVFLKELQIDQSLSPGRSNGLAHLFLRMKREALNFLVHTASKQTEQRILDSSGHLNLPS